RPVYRLAQADLAAGRVAEAAALFRRTLQLDRLHHGAAYGLARAAALAGDAEESARWTRRHRAMIENVEELRRALRRLPSAEDQASARFDIASQYLLLEDNDEAERWLDRTLEVDPHHAGALALKDALRAAGTEDAASRPATRSAGGGG
ncbi:MAG TPA: hypothetical protein VEI02_06700, partial [Planctomycetota bacterium]|nr:hypothetical protein [Planctomycetota bacterium]